MINHLPICRMDQCLGKEIKNKFSIISDVIIKDLDEIFIGN